MTTAITGTQSRGNAAAGKRDRESGPASGCWSAVGGFIIEGIRAFEQEKGIAPARLRSRKGHPVPDADVLVMYEDIMPGSAERIMELAEEAQRREHLKGAGHGGGSRT